MRALCSSSLTNKIGAKMRYFHKLGFLALSWTICGYAAPQHTEIDGEQWTVNAFKELEKELQTSEDPIAEARRFLQAFIAEINQTYGHNITLQQACQIVRDNYQVFDISPEMKDEFFHVLDLLAQEEPTTPAA